MYNQMFVRGMLSLLLGLICVAFTTASEIKLKEKDMPAAVLTAFHKAYPNAKATAFSKEVENKNVEYEISTLDGTMKRDLVYLIDGTLKTVEEGIPVSALPDAVTKRIARNFPKAKIVSAERVTEGIITSYECVLMTGKQRSEVLFGEDGNILKEEGKGMSADRK